MEGGRRYGGSATHTGVRGLLSQCINVMIANIAESRHTAFDDTTPEWWVMQSIPAASRALRHRFLFALLPRRCPTTMYVHS